MALFKKKTEETASVAPVPRHVAIIMDGNGRWATNRHLPRTAGHAAGAETFRRIALHCRKLGISYLTVYAFSTENWKRPQPEVEKIMSLMKDYLLEALRDMQKNHVRIHFFGDLTALSPELQELAAEAEKESEEFTDSQVNLCINYGGRDEIVRAARAWAIRCGETGEDPANLTEEAFGKLLYSGDVPDPDLIIRPGGEMRISNFLLWQAAYAEFYYTDVLWPDFDEAELEKAVEVFRSRNRRYGGV
ncbi:MAG: polyprenyl diphosphate synthase [Oscillospiraceae bacterium]|nr:polyprenyl diphosphate synthase [Oscillospiraceae bacterium]